MVRPRLPGRRREGAGQVRHTWPGVLPLAGVLGVALLGGCQRVADASGKAASPDPLARAHASGAPAPRRAAEHAQPGVIDVVARDAALPVRLRRGELLRVHLQESPATGYYWELQPQLPNSLRLEAEPSRLPSAGGPKSDTRSWVFRALRPDQLRLRFDYRRGWDGATDARDAVVFELHVD